MVLNKTMDWRGNRQSQDYADMSELNQPLRKLLNTEQ